LPYLFGSFVYALVKILILHESNNKMRIFLGTVAENGNGCENGCGKKDAFFLELPANSRYLYSMIREEQALSESTTSQHLRIKNNNTLPKPKKDGTRQ
jgi:hypothetical protein